jgi:hypothetical protein
MADDEIDSGQVERILATATTRLTEPERDIRVERTGNGATPLGAIRSFVDPDGDCWKAYEVASLSSHPEHGPALVFTSETVWRRVRRYPTDWSSLSDEELTRLSWQR